MSWDDLFGDAPAKNQQPHPAQHPEQQRDNGQKPSHPTSGSPFGAAEPGNAGFGSARPERFHDLPSRPAPLPPNMDKTEDWFVGPVPERKEKGTKKILKRTVSIVFPALGIIVLVSVVAIILKNVVGIYG